MDRCQFPELRLLNKHWQHACDALTTKLSISNRAVTQFGSSSLPLDTVTRRFPALQSLVVWKLHSRDAFMLSRLRELTLLDIAGTAINNQSLQHLAYLTKLTVLQLWETDIGDEGVQFLSGLRQLAFLNLRDSKITSSGMLHIACLTNLTSLHLDRTDIGDEGARHFPSLRKLQRLSLWNTHVGDEGVAYLAQLTDLVRLNLGFTRVTWKGLQHLSELTKLTSLELWGTEKSAKRPGEASGEEGYY